MMTKPDTMARFMEHYYEAEQLFDKDNIVGLFLQGSQNYGLDYEHSDVDTKLILTPSLHDIIINNPPVSTTYVRKNDEHIDLKDIRLYIQTFRKQNINFIEILFTDYFVINPKYEQWWNLLVTHREEIAHYNMFRAVKTMKGVAMEKYNAMEHQYPSKAAVLAEFGYDPKQVSHLVRLSDFITRYIAGERYEDCLTPKNADFVMDIKMGKYNLSEARKIAEENIQYITKTCDAFTTITPDQCDSEVENLFNHVQYCIMEASLKTELGVK